MTVLNSTDSTIAGLLRSSRIPPEEPLISHRNLKVPLLITIVVNLYRARCSITFMMFGFASRV